MSLLILGMHRSGTSAATRLCNLLGADLGGNLLAPIAGWNEAGLWEHREVVRLHDLFLAGALRSWYDAEPMDPRAWRRPAARNLRERLVDLLRRDFSGSALWAVKDPRLCRLIPVWQQVLDEVAPDRPKRALIVLRHPAEVMASLERRDGMPREKAMRLWAYHMLEAERHTRGWRRAVIRYDALIADWRGTAAAIARQLDLAWPVGLDDAAPAIEAFLRPSLRHHRAVGASAGMPETIGAMQALLAAAAEGAPVPEHEFDRLAERFAAEEEALRPSILRPPERRDAEVARRRELKLGTEGEGDLAGSFNAHFYLRRHADVRRALAIGMVGSAFEHWSRWGRAEGRQASFLPDDGSACAFPPVVVGGTGGSGTRAVQRLLSGLGVFMGDFLNVAGDAMMFEPFLETELAPLLAQAGRVDYRPDELPAPVLARVETRLAAVLEGYQAECPVQGPWGWKNPRSLYLLPLLKRRFDRFTFIHVLRDGRDMALSRNQNQLHRYHAPLGMAPSDSPAVRSAAFWQRVNLEVSGWCRRELGDRCILLRYEDLCDRPAETAVALRERLTALGHGPLAPVPEDLTSIVAPSPSRGRWRSLPAEDIRAIETVSREALERFGFETLLR